MTEVKQTLHVLGTGHATVTKCYNTCFALQDNDDYFLVDAGGGNGILQQLEKADISINCIHHIFVSHRHTDHVLGVIWMIRMAATEMLKGNYSGKLKVYGHDEVIHMLQTFCDMTLAKKHLDLLGDRIQLIVVTEGETVNILGFDVTFFDIFSTKAKQYGFTTFLADGSILTFVGDEPYNEACERYVIGSKWLLHEAFCLNEDRDKYHPYEKHHGTVLDAAKTAQQLMVENLVLWHSEDDTITERKVRYKKEAEKVFDGTVFIPLDLETITLINI